MTETVAAALIGVAGAVIVALASALAQLGITRSVIRAERERVHLQILGEEQARRREQRERQFLDSVAELLAVSDPQVAPGPDYGKAVVLIHRIQLLLDPEVSSEGALNGAVNQLGVRLQEYHFVRQRAIDDKLAETRRLLEAQSAVSDLTRAVIQRSAVPAT